MGLCKCQKRKVTNLFCFEHDVNVCEYCLVADHERVNYKQKFQIIKYIDNHALIFLSFFQSINSKTKVHSSILCSMAAGQRLQPDMYFV
jgi:hypothetical protein